MHENKKVKIPFKKSRLKMGLAATFITAAVAGGGFHYHYEKHETMLENRANMSNPTEAYKKLSTETLEAFQSSRWRDQLSFTLGAIVLIGGGVAFSVHPHKPAQSKPVQMRMDFSEADKYPENISTIGKTVASAGKRAVYKAKKAISDLTFD